MVKQNKIWVFDRKNLKTKAPEDIKERVLQLADKLVETDLKPRHIKRPPKNNKYNYIVDIYTKWHGNSLYFCAKYNSSDDMSSFINKFARLEYLKTGKFDLAYFRYTGKWWPTEMDIEFKEALKLIKAGGIYEP